jgi:hypothetical protein
MIMEASGSKDLPEICLPGSRFGESVRGPCSPSHVRTVVLVGRKLQRIRSGSFTRRFVHRI